MCFYCSVPGLLQFSLPWCSCLCALLFHCCINVDTFHSFVFSSPITCTSHTHQLLNCSLNIDANDLTGTLPTEFGQLKELRSLSHCKYFKIVDVCFYYSVPGPLNLFLHWCSCLCTLSFNCGIHVDWFSSFFYALLTNHS